MRTPLEATEAVVDSVGEETAESKKDRRRSCTRRSCPVPGVAIEETEDGDALSWRSKKDRRRAGTSEVVLSSVVALGEELLELVTPAAAATPSKNEVRRTGRLEGLTPVVLAVGEISTSSTAQMRL